MDRIGIAGRVPTSTLQRPGAQAGDHVFLDDEEHPQHGRENEQAGGHDHPPIDHGGIVEVGDADGQGLLPRP